MEESSVERGERPEKTKNYLSYIQRRAIDRFLSDKLEADGTVMVRIRKEMAEKPAVKFREGWSDGEIARILTVQLDVLVKASNVAGVREEAYGFLRPPQKALPAPPAATGSNTELVALKERCEFLMEYGDALSVRVGKLEETSVGLLELVRAMSGWRDRIEQQLTELGKAVSESTRKLATDRQVIERKMQDIGANIETWKQAADRRITELGSQDHDDMNSMMVLAAAIRSISKHLQGSPGKAFDLASSGKTAIETAAFKALLVRQAESRDRAA